MHNCKHLSVGTLIKVAIMTAVFTSFITFPNISYGIQVCFGSRQPNAPELELNLASTKLQTEFDKLMLAMKSHGFSVSEELQTSIKYSLQQTVASGSLVTLNEIWKQQYKNIISDDSKLQSAMMDNIMLIENVTDEAIKNVLDQNINRTVVTEHQSAIDFFAVDHANFLMTRAAIIGFLNSKHCQMHIGSDEAEIYSHFENYDSSDLKRKVILTSLNKLLENKPLLLNNQVQQIIKAQEKEDPRIIRVRKRGRYGIRSVDRKLRSEDINTLAKKLKPTEFGGQQNFSTFLKQHYKYVTQQSDASKWRKIKGQLLSGSSSQFDLKTELKQAVGSIFIEHYFGSSALRGEVAQADKVKLDAAEHSITDHSDHGGSIITVIHCAETAF